jgi:hypothetical protein
MSADAVRLVSLNIYLIKHFLDRGLRPTKHFFCSVGRRSEVRLNHRLEPQRICGLPTSRPQPFCQERDWPGIQRSMLRHPGWCINDGEVPCAAKSTGSRRIDSAVASIYQVIPDRLMELEPRLSSFIWTRLLDANRYPLRSQTLF